MRIDQTTQPHHLLKAYGVGPTARTAPSAPVAAVRPAGPSEAASRLDRLTAAVVPGRIDFTGETPRPASAGALPFYRHPADRNAAATAVAIGRTLDMQG